MPNKKALIKKHKVKIKLFFLIFLSFFILFAGIVLLWFSTFKIPDLSSFETRKVSQSTKLYDRTGTVLLYDLNQGVKRTVVADSEISRNIKNATVAIEDAEFYQHHGIKITAIIRAILANVLRGGYQQGGSTITQQVVKNSLLTSEKKISRKLKEWVLALKLERVLDKTAILDIYLNETPYGGNIYGVEEASQTYFGKKAADLTLAESAYLASLPNAPTYYSPYGNNKGKLEDRKNLVLKRMLENKFITDAEYKGARREKVSFKAQEDTGLKAPHFVMFIRQYLENQYGRQMIEQGGLKVITTLDYNLQQKAEEIVKRNALQNQEKFNAENAAMTAIDPKTGQILVMVGSRDYFDKKIDGNFNVALAHRQPGSSFKPFVYSEAFIKGYTPDTVVFDLSTEFSSECNPDGTPIVKGNEDKCYKPENYDHVYRGPITLRNALAQSINIPAIKVLYLAGLRDSLRLAKDFGITSLTNTDQYGLTLVLGGGEVSLLEMTDAYSVFADNGVRNPYSGILGVEDRDGNTLEKFEYNPSRVISEDVAETISDILSDNEARAPAFSEHSALYIPGRDVAVKTGTTNNYRDAWVIGYTPQIAVGAWAGNNDNRPMEKRVAGFIVAPMWNEFMREALKQYPPENFKKPPTTDLTTLKPVLAGFWQGGTAYFVNKTTGEKATVYTPPPLREERVVTQVHSILYWLDKNNPNGPQPEHPENDPQFNLWEYAVKQWASEKGIVEESNNIIPTKEDSAHLPAYAPEIKIENPIPSAVYSKNNKIIVTLASVSHFPLSKVDFFINGIYAGSSVNYPWSFSFIPSTLDNLNSLNELKVVAYDAVLNKSETLTYFKVGI